MLEDVWCGKSLAIRVESGQEHFRLERSSGGRVDLGAPPRGGSIVVPTSGTLELEVALPARTRIGGRVVDSAGSGVAGAHVRVDIRGRSTGAIALECDAEGRFSTSIVRPGRPVHVELSAFTGTKSTFPQMLEALPVHAGRRVGRRAIEIGDSALDVEIVVEPALSISGVVRGRDGSPRRARVAACASSRADAALRSIGASCDEDGRFEIGGLLPGDYALEVRPRENFVFTDCLLSHRFEGFAAGSRDVVLELAETPGVDVEIDLRADDGTPTEMTVVLGIFKPYVARDPAGCVPAIEATYPGLGGWNDAASLGFGGQSGAIGEDGATGFLHLGAKAPTHRMQRMNPGWYSIGIDARDAQGERYKACGTGLVYLEPGAYRFRFDLVRQTTIDGVIENVAPDTTPHLQLVTRAGEPIQLLHTDRHVATIVAAGAGGRFRLSGVPPGEHRLRVGDERELREGRYAAEVEVRVDATENAPLRIVLP